MPHAALWVVQPYPSLRRDQRLEVSMPHAALWVVQRLLSKQLKRASWCFNAARGFVGGAAPFTSLLSVTIIRFNAARGFVCGAASGVLLSEMG